MVVHFGILHIGLNMLALWRIGPPVERVVGSKLYLMAYVLSGVGGQVVSDLATKSVVLADGSRVWPLSGGASGAIFGVIGLLVAYYAATAVAERAGRRPTSNWRFNPKAVISLAVQATIWLLIAGPLFHFDSAAHAGGAAVGLVIGAFVGWSRTAPPPPPSPSTRLTHLE
jgi:rhomboid protease GluP